MPLVYFRHYRDRGGRLAGGAAQPGPNTSFFACGADVRNSVVVLTTKLFVQNEYE